MLVELGDRVAGAGKRVRELDPIACGGQSTEKSWAHHLSGHEVMVMMVEFRSFSTRSEQ